MASFCRPLGISPANLDRTPINMEHLILDMLKRDKYNINQQRGNSPRAHLPLPPQPFGVAIPDLFPRSRLQIVAQFDYLFIN